MINIRKADIDDVITISKLGRITFPDTFESFQRQERPVGLLGRHFFGKKDSRCIVSICFKSIGSSLLAISLYLKREGNSS